MNNYSDLISVKDKHIHHGVFEYKCNDSFDSSDRCKDSSNHAWEISLVTTKLKLHAGVSVNTRYKIDCQWLGPKWIFFIIVICEVDNSNSYEYLSLHLFYNDL